MPYYKLVTARKHVEIDVNTAFGKDCVILLNKIKVISSFLSSIYKKQFKGLRGTQGTLNQKKSNHQ